jgi:hypothetical protein
MRNSNSKNKKLKSLQTKFLNIIYLLNNNKINTTIQKIKSTYFILILELLMSQLMDRIFFRKKKIIVGLLSIIY